jgi:putative ABC transport system permease protein
MTGFIIKGVLRDRSRSLFPVLTVTIGVALAVFMDAYLRGAEDSIFDATARLMTGHLRVVARARLEPRNQNDNRFVLEKLDSLISALSREYPDIRWQPRIRFNGVVRSDKPGNPEIGVAGLGIDLNPEGEEIERLRLKRGLIAGSLPAAPGGVLLGVGLANELEVSTGDSITVITSRSDGEAVAVHYSVAGIVRFGVTGLDRRLLVMDINDLAAVLGMENAASEVLGFFTAGFYDDRRAVAQAQDFNRRSGGSNDQRAPVMQSLREASGFGSLIDIVGSASGLIVAIFVLAMAVVLWNAGLLNSLRRYQEIGIRLALGESKVQIYWSMLIEALVVGLVGSIFGTVVGLSVSLYLQNHGLDISGMMRNAAVVMEDVIRARIAPRTLIIGFVPGLIATITGSALSGVGIFRRSPARLTRELSE